MIEEIKSIRGIIDADNDIKKCRQYILMIQHGNYSQVSEMVDFANQKFIELCVTDSRLVLTEMLVNMTISQKYIDCLIERLVFVHDLLIAKKIKEILKISALG